MFYVGTMAENGEITVKLPSHNTEIIADREAEKLTQTPMQVNSVVVVLEMKSRFKAKVVVEKTDAQGNPFPRVTGHSDVASIPG